LLQEVSLVFSQKNLLQTGHRQLTTAPTSSGTATPINNQGSMFSGNPVKEPAFLRESNPIAISTQPVYHKTLKIILRFLKTLTAFT
jgi:hypothetical protein